MLEGKQLILATKPYAKENRITSWFHTLLTLFLLYASFTGTLLMHFWPLRLACSIFAGLLIVRMFIIYHDFQHKTILTNSKLADLIFTIFGLYVMVPKSIWRESHDDHHKHNSKLFTPSFGSYPIYSKEEFLKSSKMDRFHYLFVRHPLIISCGYFFAFTLGLCLKSFLTNFKKYNDSFLALVLQIAYQYYVFHYLGWQPWVFFCAIPNFIFGALGAYLFYAQHNFPDATFKAPEDWNYLEAALESSSYMEMSKPWRWITANVGYHHIHHVNARIPFYRLPEVFNAFPELQNAKKTSLKIKDIVACFKLKVWDIEAQKMVGIKFSEQQRDSFSFDRESDATNATTNYAVLTEQEF